MHYLALDTNTWIYLANGTEPVKFLVRIIEGVNSGNIKVVVPETVLKEWETHKDKTVRQGSIKHFNKTKEALDKLVKLLGEKGEPDMLLRLFGDEKDKEYFKEFADKFNLKKREIEDAVTDNIKSIDELFKSNALLIPIKDEIYVQAGKFALEKKAPFKMKNSFADALIVFSFLDYLKSNDLKDGMFISYNTEDYCEKTDNKRQLHTDLKPVFEAASCSYYKILGEALKTIDDAIASFEELRLIEEKQEREDWSYEPEFCRVCEDNERYSMVSMCGTADLIDERLSAKADPTKIYDFSRNTIQPLTDNAISSIEVGHCDWCNTLHFVCIHCHNINTMEEHEFNEAKECEGCGLEYLVNRSWDSDGIDEIEYTIPKHTTACQKCGNEFDPDELIEGICESCEDEYSYGEK